mgnify:CR=1 FL=1
MILITTRNRAFMTEASGSLLAKGISPIWIDGECPGVWYLDMPEDCWWRSYGILNEMYAEDLQRVTDYEPPLVWVPLLLRPAFILGLGLALVAISFYYLAIILFS